MTTTDQTTTTEATEQTTEAPEPTDAPEQPDNPNAEAKKYRLRLRETEAELTEAREQVTANAETIERLQRTLIERAAAEQLTDPADLWRYAEDTTTADLLAEDGTPDPEKVTAAVTAVVAERGYLAKTRTPRPDLSQGASGNAPTRSADPIGDYLAGTLR